MKTAVLSEIEANLVQLAASTRDEKIARLDATFNNLVGPVLRAHEAPNGARLEMVDGKLTLQWEEPDA